MRANSARSREESQADPTPMIDVVFLLIVFFLCLDFRVLEAKLPAYLPRDVGSNGVLPAETLDVQVCVERYGTKWPRRPEDPHGAWSLRGHEVSWRLGPKPIRSLDELRQGLRRIAEDPAKLQRDSYTGMLQLPGVVIQPQVGTTNGDVALTMDAVRQAGFGKVSYGGGTAPHAGRRPQRRRVKPRRP